MARVTPVAELLNRAAPMLIPYGPSEAGVACVGLFPEQGGFPVEYAAIRKASALYDDPTRGTIVITGKDRLDFLNRMLTQELKGFGAMTCRRSFWLNKKGRIDGDLRLINMGDRIIVDVDTFAAPRCVTGLNAYVIAEDVTVVDESEAWHRLQLHGPGAASVLAARSSVIEGVAIDQIQPGQVARVSVGGTEVIADRWDSAGEIGLHLLMPASGASAVYAKLLEAAHDVGNGPNLRPALRPIGWLALNTARIEAGTPMYNIDFGPESLPGETGVLNDRVSFTKGCYLGQEIVARMHALGAPKQIVVALKLDGPAQAQGDELAPLCEAGGAVFADESSVDPIGTITSATLAPMVSRSAVALASVKFKHASAGTRVWVVADGVRTGATIQGKLAFYPK
jgi:folate-binding protein YgfZ